jgi:L-alanine-DL-glutamate epimerase-like enolase superfamily enzyme
MSNVRTVEMGGPLMLREDIGAVREWYDRDQVSVPDTPGLGIDVDTDRVREFSTAWWTIS